MDRRGNIWAASWTNVDASDDALAFALLFYIVLLCEASAINRL